MGVDISIIGIFLTSFIALIVYLYKEWQSFRKHRKKLLFLLLEIRHVLDMFTINSENIYNQYLEYVKNKKYASEEVFNSKIEEEQLKTLIINYLDNLAITKVNSLRKNIFEKFELEIEKISEHTPLLAFQLKSYRHVLEVVEQMLKYLEKLECTFNHDFDRHLSNGLLSISKNISFDELFKELEDDIILISKKISRSTFKKVSKIIEHRKYKSEFDFSSLEVYFQEAEEYISNNSYVKINR